MAGILDFLGGAGSAFGDAASGVGGAIGDAGSALQNMAGSAVSAAQPAFSGVGNWLMGSGEYAAPEAADRRQAQINMLSKLGGTLLASGAYQTPDSRAKHLAKLGDIGSGYTADLLKQQQARLLGTQLRQKMSAINALKGLDAMRRTPAGASAIARQTGIDPSIIMSLPIEKLSELQQQIAIKTAVRRARAAEMQQIMGPLGSGGAPAAPAASPPQRTGGQSIDTAIPDASDAQRYGGDEWIDNANPAAPSPTGGAAPQNATPVAPVITLQTLEQKRNYKKQLAEAMKRAAAAGEKDAVIAIKAIMDQSVEEKSPGQLEADKAFGKDNYSWLTKGKANAKADLANLKFSEEQLRRSLKNGDRLTGTWLQIGADYLPSGMAILSPKTQAAQDAILTVAQRSLKEILGGQFAQKEGEQFLARAFNPKLSVEENLRRIGILAQTVKDVAAAKTAASEHFQKYGTMAQFKGMTYTDKSVMQDLDRKWSGSGDKPQNQGAQDSPKVINFLALPK